MLTIFFPPKIRTEFSFSLHCLSLSTISAFLKADSNTVKKMSGYQQEKPEFGEAVRSYRHKYTFFIEHLQHSFMYRKYILNTPRNVKDIFIVRSKFVINNIL